MIFRQSGEFNKAGRILIWTLGVIILITYVVTVVVSYGVDPVVPYIWMSFVLSVLTGVIFGAAIYLPFRCFENVYVGALVCLTALALFLWFVYPSIYAFVLLTLLLMAL